MSSDLPMAPSGPRFQLKIMIQSWFQKFTRMDGSKVKEVDRGFTQKPLASIQIQFYTQNSMVDSPVILDPEYSLNTCITVQVPVKLSKPTPIEHVANLTKVHETSNTIVSMCKPVINTPHFGLVPISNKPMVNNNTHVQTQNTKHIVKKTPRSFNAAEEVDKMAKGLCMFCDEFFTLGQQLKHRRFKLLVMEGEEEEPIYEEVEAVD